MHVGQGDLTHDVEVTSTDEVGPTLDALDRMMDNVRNTVRDVMAASTKAAAESEKMSSTAEQLSQDSTEQAASAEETTSATPSQALDAPFVKMAEER